jgi:hypothetical protein
MQFLELYFFYQLHFSTMELHSFSLELVRLLTIDWIFTESAITKSPAFVLFQASTLLDSLLQLHQDKWLEQIRPFE